MFGAKNFSNAFIFATRRPPVQKQSPRQLAQLFIVLVLIFSLGVQVKPASAADPFLIVVNSTGDKSDFEPGRPCETAKENGECTLRAAIELANYGKSIHGTLITFDIDRESALGPTFISIGSALPRIELVGSDGGVTIQGPNLKDGSAIVLDGGGSGTYAGLEIRANNCAVKKLIISNFGGYGIVVGASSIPALTGTLITGNKIGDLAPLSLYPKPNGGGIKLINVGSSFIGGVAPGERNVIAGNTGHGISIEGGGTNQIIGNYIGVNSDGTQALPNSSGINIDGSYGNTIGGDTPEERNIISGNNSFGIFIEANGNAVTGNFVGTDATGTQSIPNKFSGVRIGNSGTVFGDNWIGGEMPGEGNLISGNGNAGIALANTERNTITNNTIGLNLAQTAALPNLFGVTVDGSTNNFIVGTNAETENVIAGNTRQGIFVGEGSQFTYIRGNRIGVNSSDVGFGNGMDGIMVQYASDTTIGSDDPSYMNMIAHNGENGIEVESADVIIAGNSIFNNGKLGIDVWRQISQQGVTPNDASETDNIQNFPVLSSVSFPSIGAVLLNGHLATLASEALDIYFYGSNICDPSGYGEGQIYLGKLEKTANASGLATFSVELPLTTPLLCFTATAYGPSQSSSEFSAWLAPYSVYLPLIMR